MRIVFLFIISCCFALTGLAQQIKEKTAAALIENMKQYFNETDADFSANAIPSKWKSEAGVIIAQKTTVTLDRKKDRVLVVEKERRKLMLNDQFAVNQYSELYFRVADDDEGFAARVIKADGKVQEIDLKQAVLVEDRSDVPGRFKAYTDRNSFYSPARRADYYKVPVPDLIAGDVIEYAYLVNNDVYVSKRAQSFEFDPIYFTCNREFSVMKQKFIIVTDDKTFLNYKSLNGAPEFKEIPGGNDVYTYTWEDSDREKIKDTRFVNEYLVLPMMKFQVVFASRKAKDVFVGDKEALKTSISEEELGKKAAYLINQLDRSSYGSYFNGVDLKAFILGQLKKMDAKNFGEDDYVRLCYYLMRHFVALSDERMSSLEFVFIFTELLDARKIPYQILLTTPNNVTKMNDLLFKEELLWLVRYNNKHIYNFTPYSNVYDLKENCLGNPAYIINFDKTPTVTATTLPATVADENAAVYTVDAALDSSFENISVTTTNAMRGMVKEDYSGLALAYTQAFEEDHKTYGGYSDVEQLPEKMQEQYYRMAAVRREEYKKRKPEYMKRMMEDEYPNVLRYDAFKLMADGRSFKKNELKYSETFVLGDMVKRAGKKLLVSIPGLITSQLQIKTEERNRQFDIDVRYPKSYTWNIAFSIPAGYTVAGLSDLAMNIDNEAGTFIATAKVEGGKLLLTVVKKYKQQLVNKADWSKMLQFIDAAYNYSQKKILLKKG
jgi:Domain of Unknown Function with PDB structure (DUF3857)